MIRSPQVYLLRSDVDSFRTVNAIHKAGRDVLSGLCGRPVGDNWTPVRVRMGGLKPVGDVTSLGAHLPVFGPRAIEALRDLIEPYGELLPLHCGDQQWFAYHVTFFADCLDYEKIQGDRFDDGRMYAITSYAFLPARVRDLIVFRTPGLAGDLFVTEPFKSRVETAGLTGFRLPAVWPRQDPWTSPLGP